MEPKITSLNFTYKKEGSEVWVLNTDSIPVDKSKVKDIQLVHLAPKSVGGNHKHPRTEWFVGIGNLELVWVDKSGNKQTEKMNPNGQLKLIEIPPYLPHAVVNVSQDRPAILFEMADAKQGSVENVKIVANI